MHETVLLSDPKSPLRVEYSRAAMEEIRERAREGLMAAPRVGVGVGGLLLGVREGGRTRIVDSMEIPCCHSGGPSFRLTAEEMQQTRETMAEAGEITAKTRIAVVGWYCSKTRGDAVLNEFDQQFHDELFPETWQIALVLRPSAAEPMRAVFYFRDDTGTVRRGVECEVEEWSPPEMETGATEASAATAAVAEAAPGPKPVEPVARAAKVIEMTPPAARVVEPLLETPPQAAPQPAAIPRAETTLADVIGVGAADEENHARHRPAATNADLFGMPDALPLKPRNANKIFMAVVIAVTLLAIAGGAYFTRNSWMPKQPLNLTSTELNGSLLIRWNPDAVKGINSGTMYISDGSGNQPQAVELDRFQLGSGLLNYALKTKQVTATLDAGNIHERTAWFAPPPATPTPGAAEPATTNTPATAAPPPAPGAENKPTTTVPAQDNPAK